MLGVIHPRSPWVEMRVSPGCRVASSTGSTVPLTTKSTVEPLPHGACRPAVPTSAETTDRPAAGPRPSHDPAYEPAPDPAYEPAPDPAPNPPRTRHRTHPGP